MSPTRTVTSAGMKHSFVSSQPGTDVPEGRESVPVNLSSYAEGGSTSGSSTTIISGASSNPGTGTGALIVGSIVFSV